MSLQVKEFYKGKSIMITGCTGYLAKITLEKLLRTCTDFKRIYVLIRAKQGMTLQARMQKEIYSSFIFQHLFEKRPDLKKIAHEKITPI